MKKTLLIFFVFLCFSLSAKTDPLKCKTPKKRPGEITKMTKNTSLILTKLYKNAQKPPIKRPAPQGDIGNMPWSIASINQMKNAPCKVKLAPTVEQLNRFISSKLKTTEKNENATVNDVHLENEAPELINAFRALTTMYNTLGTSIDTINQKDIQGTYNINPTCHKVECALEKIWPNNFGKKLLYIYLKHNINASELAFKNSSRFTAEELNDVLIALEDMPNSVLPIAPANQRMTHYLRGYVFTYSPTAFANAGGMIFDTWSRLNSAQRQYTIFHEISHIFSDHLSNLDTSSEWLNLSGWYKMGADWKNQNGCFPSAYSRETPGEDFAESVTFYRYNATYFKKKCANKYNFIKEKIFKGIEFTSENLCINFYQEDKVENVEKENKEEKIEEEEKTSFKTYPLEETKELPIPQPIDDKKNEEISEDEKYLKQLENDLNEIRTIPSEQRTTTTSETDILYLIEMQKRLIQIKKDLENTEKELKGQPTDLN